MVCGLDLVWALESSVLFDLECQTCDSTRRPNLRKQVQIIKSLEVFLELSQVVLNDAVYVLHYPLSPSLASALLGGFPGTVWLFERLS